MTPLHRRTWLTALLHASVLLGPALLGAAVVLFATAKWGLGVSWDSVIYLDAAQTIATHGVVATQLPDGSIEPLVWFPPLYPLLLSRLGVALSDIHAAARGMNALMFALAIALASLLVYDSTRVSVLAAGVVGLLVMLAHDLQSVHARVWSETLFLLLQLCFLLLLAHWIASGRLSSMVGAALFAALACLTRYAGVAMIAVGVLAALLLVELPLSSRLRYAAGFAVLSAAPLGLLLLGNTGLESSPTGRNISFHAISSEEWRQALDAIAGWFLPGASPLGLKIAAVVTASGILSYFVIRGLRHGPKTAIGSQPTARLRVMLLFIPTYLATVVITMTLVDDATALDFRMLAPVIIALLPALAISLSMQRLSKFSKVLTVLLMIWVFSLWGWRTANWVSAAHATGLEYAKAQYRESSALQSAANLSGCATIHSNNPQLVHFVTGHRALDFTELDVCLGHDTVECASAAGDVPGKACAAIWVAGFAQDHHQDFQRTAEQHGLLLVAADSVAQVYSNGSVKRCIDRNEASSDIP